MTRQGWSKIIYEMVDTMIDRNGQPLKKQIIDALKQLGEQSIYQDKINDLLKDLSVRKIPDSDYKNMMEYIWRVANHLPKIMDNHPNDQALKDLFNYCYACVAKAPLEKNVEKNSRRGRF